MPYMYVLLLFQTTFEYSNIVFLSASGKAKNGFLKLNQSKLKVKIKVSEYSGYKSIISVKTDSIIFLLC